MGLTHNLPLPKGYLDFESAGSNRGPDHKLIAKYQVKPLAYAGTWISFIFVLYLLIITQDQFINGIEMVCPIIHLYCFYVILILVSNI